MAKYERARVVKVLAKTSVHKGLHYKEVVEILSQQTNESDSDSTNDKELSQAEACMAK